ncbi:MAG: VWA domain-containing protein [Pyrinomonadaceae bacterium]
MKVLVASVFFATVLTAIAPAQTGQRVNKQRASGSARNGNIKICQGVPIPAGYVIVSYMTSADCPHGAYVIRKQNTDYESSMAAHKKQVNEPESPVAVKKGRGTQTHSAAAADKAPSNKFPNTVAENRQASSAAGAVASRPRRVGSEEAEAPFLRGVDPRPAPGPPKLGGVTATGVDASANEVAATGDMTAPGPEEVSEGDIVRINTALVTVPVSVLDRQGRFVPNLRREDFSVFENGVEQSIAYFEPAEKPFTVALLLDTSASTHFHLWEIKAAALAFARQLRPQDRVLVVSFNDQVLLLTEATNDINVVSAVVEQYATSGDSTRLYDAVDLIVKERLAKIKGRKAIVLFTDGVDTSSYGATYESTLREAEELDALIYPIQYDTSDYLRAMQAAGSGTVTIVTTNSSWPFPGRTTTQVINANPTAGGAAPPGTTKADYERANQYLHELANKTGGRLYEANNTTQLAQAFSQIAEELRRQYSIGYYPQAVTDQTGDRRQIKVRVHKPNVAVRTRDGYVRASSPNATP